MFLWLEHGYCDISNFNCLFVLAGPEWISARGTVSLSFNVLISIGLVSVEEELFPRNFNYEARRNFFLLQKTVFNELKPQKNAEDAGESGANEEEKPAMWII